MVVAAGLAAGGTALAQPAGVAPGAAPAAATPSVAPQASDEEAENYLAERGLWEVLAARLRRQQREGTKEEQDRAVELLGTLYVRMLTAATTPEARQAIDAACRELLKDPRAETPELRLALAKANYLKVEEIVERDRLRIGNGEDRAEAERVLRTVMPVFDEIGRKMEAKVKALEVKEKAANVPDMEALRAELGEQRRIRSLAWYYAGWSHYYMAVLTHQNGQALEAKKRFGGLLNAVSPEQPATIDRLPKNMLRFEHVARAAMGCALCDSLLGDHIRASRWLDEVQQADEVAPTVLDQLFTRRIIVHAAAGQWADIDLAVRHRRKPESTSPVTPLSVAEARLLAVAALEAAKTAQSTVIREAVEKQAQIALGDLIQRGAIRDVGDMVKLYGTAPIGEEGFIAAYVRALQPYDKAREAHAALGNEQEPTPDVGVVNQYREAAALLKAAAEAVDAGQFPKERETAAIREGLALFYAGDLEAAARQLQAAADICVTPKQKRDALWFAIVAMDRAVERGNKGLVQERDRVATLYLQQFPASENAARLLLRQARADKLTDAQALEILLKVPPDSAIYEASRKQAARLLFQAYRKAGPGEKDFAALRFVDVAESALKLEQARAMAGKDSVSQDAANDAVVRVRQIADALLSVNVPDIARVEAALAVLDTIAEYQHIDLAQLQGELTFRRVQVAVARNDEAAIVKLVDQLRAGGGPFADATDRLLYRRAARAMAARTEDAGLARQVVRYGARVLEMPGADKDPAAPGMRESVAAAAAMLFRTAADKDMRALAIQVDSQQLQAGQRTASSLRRLGELLESAGDKPKALAAWRELLNGLPAGGSEWYEARYESLRLLAEQSPAEAREVMSQHKVLHPEFGPEPWGKKLEALDALIGAGSVAVPGSSGNPPSSGSPSPAGPSAPAKGGGG